MRCRRRRRRGAEPTDHDGIGEVEDVLARHAAHHRKRLFHDHLDAVLGDAQDAVGDAEDSE